MAVASLRPVAAEEFFERLGGLGEPTPLEQGLASGVELVGRGLVGVGRPLAGGEDLQVARLAQVDDAGVVGPPDLGGQGPVSAGQVAGDLVTDLAEAGLGAEVEREHVIGQGVRAGRGLHRALDQGRAGGQGLLDHEELAIPGGLGRRSEMRGDDPDLGPASLGDLGDLVGEDRRVDRDREAGRQGLAVELGVGGEIDTIVDQEALAVALLFGGEVAGEAGHRDGIAVGPSPFDVEADAVGVAELDHLARDEHGLRLGRADHLGPVDLGVVDGDDQAVAVLGRARLAVEGGQGGEGRALGLVGAPAVALAMGQEPLAGGVEFGSLGPGLRERQGRQGGRLDGPAMERPLVLAFPVLAGLLAGAGRFGLRPRCEDVEDLARQGRRVRGGANDRAR